MTKNTTDRAKFKLKELADALTKTLRYHGYSAANPRVVLKWSGLRHNPSCVRIEYDVRQNLSCVRIEYDEERGKGQASLFIAVISPYVDLDPVLFSSLNGKSRTEIELLNPWDLWDLDVEVDADVFLARLSVSYTHFDLGTNGNSRDVIVHITDKKGKPELSVSVNGLNSDELMQRYMRGA